jgi:hypothetical protein
MTTSAIIVSTNKQDSPLRPERIYVGIDLGYREHVAAATPVAGFNPQYRAEGWKRIKTLKFTSDASGYQRLKRYLDRLSVDSANFLVLLEPTGGYYGLSLILVLLGKGYRVLQVDNRTVKEYRETVFGLETKTDDVDARLMARMGFLHEMVGEEFSIQPVHLVDGDAVALRVMVRDLEKLTREITRRRNQLQQIAAATFPEFKTFFRDSTAGSAARALLAHFPTPQTLAQANTDEVAEVLHSARAHSHAKRAAELQDLARSSAGALMLSHLQWRQSWIIRQLDALEEARAELLDQIRQVLQRGLGESARGLTSPVSYQPCSAIFGQSMAAVASCSRRAACPRGAPVPRLRRVVAPAFLALKAHPAVKSPDGTNFAHVRRPCRAVFIGRMLPAPAVASSEQELNIASDQVRLVQVQVTLADRVRG